MKATAIGLVFLLLALIQVGCSLTPSAEDVQPSPSADDPQVQTRGLPGSSGIDVRRLRLHRGPVVVDPEDNVRIPATPPRKPLPSADLQRITAELRRQAYGTASTPRRVRFRGASGLQTPLLLTPGSHHREIYGVSGALSAFDFWLWNGIYSIWFREPSKNNDSRVTLAFDGLTPNALYMLDCEVQRHGSGDSGRWRVSGTVDQIIKASNHHLIIPWTQSPNSGYAFIAIKPVWSNSRFDGTLATRPCIRTATLHEIPPP